MARPTYEEVLELYDQNRYVDAYAATEPLWRDAAAAERLSLEELVLAGRLAVRLGGSKASRYLFRRAAAREPGNPRVRFYCRYAARRVRDMFEDLRDLDAAPELGCDDPETEADWFCWQAMIWASMRNFSRSRSMLRRAAGLFGITPYWLYSQAFLALREDDWDGALEAIEEAWARKPTMPGIVALTGEILTKKGRFEEAVDRITAQAAAGQSYDVAKIGVWYLTARAERSPEGRRQELARAACRQANRLAPLAPLADRFTRSEIAWYNFDAAMVMNDREAVREHAQAGLGPFFDTVVKNMDEHGNGKLKVLPYKPVQQKHDTCLPSSVAAVLSVYGMEIDQEELAAVMTYGGTPIWRVQHWAAKRGLLTRNFLVTPELAGKLLDADIPFALSYLQETFAHAVAAIGIDHHTQTVIIHDPNSHRWTRFLLERLSANETPYGPHGLVVAPMEQAAAVDAILPADWELYRAEQTFWEDVYRQRRDEADRIVDELGQAYSDHALPLRLQAIRDTLGGKPGEGLRIQRRLLEQYPDCLPLKNDMLNTVSRLGNTALAREILGSIVERSIVPGLSENNKWQYPPATYVVRYVDLLRMSDQNLPKARRLLKKAMRREPFFAESLHVLADMLDQELRFEEALLPYRLAADLDPINDHYAEALAHAYRRLGREQEGIDYIRGRVSRLGKLVDGGNAWQALVRVYDMFGFPGRAIESMRQALVAHPEDDRLLAFAVYFWVNQGFWDEASSALAQLEQKGARDRYLDAACRYYMAAGRWRQAVPLCREWLARDPLSMGARECWLDLHNIENGTAAGLELARTWVAEHPAREDFEEVLFGRLGHFFADQEQEDLMRARVARSAEDGWAWQQLGRLLLDQYSVKPASERADFEAEIEAVLDECERTCPHDPATVGLRARYTEARGDAAGAVEMYAKALELNPEYEPFYDRLWRCSRGLGAEQWQAVRQLAEERLRLCPGQLGPARALALLIAERFGVGAAEDAIRRWHEFAPKDPSLAYAEAELELHHGRSRGGACRALEILETAVADFPHYMPLHYSLAEAYLIHFRRDDSRKVYESILQRDPPNSYARRRLAHALAQEDKYDDARGILETGIDLDPLDAGMRMALADLYWQQSQYAQALQVYEDGVEQMPENIALREATIEALLDVGRQEAAVETARGMVEVFPDGSYCWYVLGKTLARCSSISSRQEVEAAYKTSLRYNASLMQAVEELALMLLDQKRIADARQVFEEALPSLYGNDLCRAQCRLAWLTRRFGEGARAIEEIKEVLQEFPLNDTAWDLLIRWLEDDKNWKELKRVLSRVPPPLLEDPEFDCRRLVLLGRAGSETDELDAEWDALLENYPDHHFVHLERFDDLWEQERHDAAAAVLAAIETHHPRSPYVLARKVNVLCQQDDRDAALDVALTVWLMPGEDERWPENECWRALETHRDWVLPAIDRALAAMQDGEKIRPCALDRLVDDLADVMRQDDDGDRPRPVSEQQPFLERYHSLLAALDEATWPTAEARSTVFNKLVELGDVETVLNYRDAHPDESRTAAPIWQSIGYALSSSDRWRECCDWMADWREHPGLRMCFIADLAMSQRCLEDLEGVFETSLDAVRLLEHDHTTQFHLVNVCESALRLGRLEAFVELMSEHEPWDEDRYEGCWLPGVFDGLPALLRSFLQLTAGTSAAARRSALREIFRTARGDDRRAWVPQTAEQLVSSELGFFQRKWLYLCHWVLGR